MSERLRIVVAEDHRLLAEAYAHLLQPIGEVVETVGDGASLVEAVIRQRPDLVLTDLSMPGGVTGIEATRRVRSLESAPPVIVVTVRDERETLRAAFAAGATGYVVKSAASGELLEAAHRVMAGGTYVSPLLPAEPATRAFGAGELTDREREVLTRVASGLTAKEIAAQLGISERTVHFHKERLKQRLGVRSTMEAVSLLRAMDGGG